MDIWIIVPGCICGENFSATNRIRVSEVRKKLKMSKEIAIIRCEGTTVILNDEDYIYENEAVYFVAFPPHKVEALFDYLPY